jgi:hypothetical protein
MEVIVTVKTCSGSETKVPVIDCGFANLSDNLFPETGGTGDSGSIKRGNQFEVSDDGIISEVLIPARSTIRSLIDNPGQDIDSWRIIF